jgi:hypothetical protein
MGNYMPWVSSILQEKWPTPPPAKALPKNIHYLI